MKQLSDYPFLKFPRALIDSPLFSHISIEGRILLALILDRMNLSEINSDRFTDENGEIYVIFTVEEASDKLGCSHPKSIRSFKELETNGLIIRKRNLRSLPYRIYLTKNFSELINFDFGKLQNVISGADKILTREVTKREYSKNNNINNDIINTESSIIGFTRTEDEIREQIEYDCIVCESNKALLDEIVMIISDVLNGTSSTVRIGKDNMPRGFVIARFCRLDSEHIIYVLSGLERNTTVIRNIKPYLITMLYNAPATMEAEVAAAFAYHQNK